MSFSFFIMATIALRRICNALLISGPNLKSRRAFNPSRERQMALRMPGQASAGVSKMHFASASHTFRTKLSESTEAERTRRTKPIPDCTESSSDTASQSSFA